MILTSFTSSTQLLDCSSLTLLLRAFIVPPDRVIEDSAGSIQQRIKNGEVIDVFLCSDQERPKELIKEKLAILGSFVVYSLGRLVLWAKSATMLPLDENSLFKINKLALPDPKNSPYGYAAQQALEKLKLWSQMQTHIQLVRTTAVAYEETQRNNTDAGFIGLSQYLSLANNLGTAYWIIPQHLYPPIYHSAVVLKATKHPEEARSLLQFLRHPAALKIIHDFGFRTPEEPQDRDD
jgi:molybdate transport system substrate-binding protein